VEVARVAAWDRLDVFRMADEVGPEVAQAEQDHIAIIPLRPLDESQRVAHILEAVPDQEAPMGRGGSLSRRDTMSLAAIS
jgi:hypothetical protein